MAGRQESTPTAYGLAITWLRCKNGWTKKRLAEALGFADDAVLTKYERGDRTLTREVAVFLISPLPDPPEALDVLAFAYDLILTATRPEAASPLNLTPEDWRRAQRFGMAGGAAMADALTKETAGRIRREKEEAARQEAREPWERLTASSAEDRRDLVIYFPEFQTWPLALLACEASVHAASRVAKEALEWAALAVAIAERVQAPENWRQRLEGYCWAHLGNARRVSEDFDGADQAFAQAWDLWKTGAASDPALLPEWPLHAMEASLRRAQRRFSVALELLGKARAVSRDDSEAIARILLSKAKLLNLMEDTESAVAALEEAAPFIEATGDLRLLFALRFNMADDLCHLKRYADAANHLPLVRELAVQQANELDLVRELWLEAKVSAGQHREEEAIARLDQVIRNFTERRLPYDAALASLDLAALYLKAARAAQVKELAVAMGWIFKAKGIGREALAALSLFCEAAKQESATVELARRVITELERLRRSAPRVA